MEDIYTIKVKTSCDPRAKYPSERRYSASTVFGLAWVHLALAATTFLLACLALVNPNSAQTSAQQLIVAASDSSGIKLESSTETVVETSEEFDSASTLIISPCLLTLAALVSGLAAVLASKRWYIDQNIAWLFIAAIMSALLSLASLCMTAAWIASTADSLTSDYFNDSSLYDKFQHEYNATSLSFIHRQSKSRRVLSINILIASILELLWSLLTVRIAWKGMRRHYPEDDALDRRGGNCLEVVTEIKGNNTKYLPKNTKIVPPKPDLITQYPKNGKIKKFFIAQQELGNEKDDDFPGKESNSEYRERMFNFLNRCTSFDQGSICVSDQVCHVVNNEPEGRISRISWGDSRDHTVFDQNTLNFDKLRVIKIPKLEVIHTADTAQVVSADEDMVPK